MQKLTCKEESDYKLIVAQIQKIIKFKYTQVNEK